MKRLLDLGADGMFTNFLDRLNGLLGREAAPRKVGAKLASSANVTCRATK
jgi:hypothetical protein